MHISFAQFLVTGDRNAVTTQPHSTIRDAAELLSANEISAVLIVNEKNEIVGILSECDIVQAIGTLGVAALDNAVSIHMTWRCPTPEISDYVILASDLFE